MEAETRAIELTEAKVTDTHLVVVLSDGREIATPLAWYPRLLNAAPADRARFELSPFGIHWPDLDEDLSIDGMLSGSRASDYTFADRS